MIVDTTNNIMNNNSQSDYNEIPFPLARIISYEVYNGLTTNKSLVYDFNYDKIKEQLKNIISNNMV
jgi:hypothetical protein